MHTDLKRRIDKLEQKLKQGSTQVCQTNLRGLARKMGGDEQAFLRAVQGYEWQLGRELVGDGITWPGFQLLYKLLYSSRDGSPTQCQPPGAGEEGA
ncbi:MAG: hypothetical protein ABSH49_13530 [Bryobacteraceae bacterium]|jgi:hypothetical protein